MARAALAATVTTVLFIASLTMVGCGSSAGETADTLASGSDATSHDSWTDDAVMTGPMEIPSTYAFGGSVKYTGQIHRQVLMVELKSYISGVTDDIDAGLFMPDDAFQVVDALDFYFRFDAEADGDTPLTLTTEPALAELSFNDISTKDLVGKLAGNDTVTDHRNWKALEDGTPSQFIGWPGVESPEALVTTYFEMIGENAVRRSQGDYDHPVYLTEAGQDLNQLVQKFLGVAVGFSQGADDYLDDDVDGKGLHSSNEPSEDAPYTDLAHAWDEGFGYFGAARDYADYTDDESAAKGGRDDWQGHHDSDGDGFISLTSEYNFGASLNAAKRDRGASTTAPTDLTKDIFVAFLEGRTLIHNNPGPLGDEVLAELQSHRDAIVSGWELTYAATVVHYINDVLQDMAAIGTDEYSFADHAKHWSEMKGFALGFQFNPRSPLDADDFGAFHQYVGTAPVLDGDQALDDYRSALLMARSLLQDAYGIDGANIGDDTGNNGW